MRLSLSARWSLVPIRYAEAPPAFGDRRGSERREKARSSPERGLRAWARPSSTGARRARVPSTNTQTNESTTSSPSPTNSCACRFAVSRRLDHSSVLARTCRRWRYIIWTRKSLRSGSLQRLGSCLHTRGGSFAPIVERRAAAADSAFSVARDNSLRRRPGSGLPSAGQNNSLLSI